MLPSKLPNMTTLCLQCVRSRTQLSERLPLPSNRRPLPAPCSIATHVKLQPVHANDDKTEAAYDHALYLPQRTKLMQWWADHLETELNKEKTKVVAVHKTA
jgi:hypothetical protein